MPQLLRLLPAPAAITWLPPSAYGSGACSLRLPATHRYQPRFSSHALTWRLGTERQL